MSGLASHSESAGQSERPAVPIAHSIAADLAVTMELPAYDALALFEATCEQAAVGISHLRDDETWQWVNQRYCEVRKGDGVFGELQLRSRAATRTMRKSAERSRRRTDSAAPRAW
jgi:hypothetical protein